MHSPPTSTEDDIPVHKEQQQQEFKTGTIDGGRKDVTIDMERRVTPPPEEYEFGNDDDDSKGSLALIYDTYRPWFHLAMWLIFTGFLVAAYILQVPKGYNSENLILGLIYACFTLYIISQYISFSRITRPVYNLGHSIMTPFLQLSKRWRLSIYALFVTTVIVATVFSFPETKSSTRKQRLISLFGLVVFLLLLTASSHRRKAINWFIVCSGLLFQFLLALFVFRSSVGHDIFQWMSNFVQGFLGMARHGMAFLTTDPIANLPYFAVVVFPAVIFFSAVVQMLYHLGALQWISTKFAVIFIKLFQVSGVEAIVAAASPFLGQGESSLLIRPYLRYATRSELHQIMTSGFATVAGSMLAGYMALGVSGEALLTSCIMSIPCSLMVSKIRYPETQESLTKHEIKIPPADPSDRSSNLLHALANGASIGISVMLCMASNIIAILSLLYAINTGLTWLGHFVNIQELSLEMITGYIFVPMAWLMGVDNGDLVTVGRLMALKIWANEYMAYQTMMTTYAGQLSERSTLVATYALCGFANVPGMGIQIGVLGSLAPGRTGDISKLVASAMVCGFISTCVSAAMAGMLS
ncbi:hypothetical protein LRAMOSA07626 [Lichtheimia ramosa]|uniref:Concentrative nucleoside transporter C-terminal domain-containing protein n=1 Tax=Lichtheimia ramosa TaxID=688394 RepID=A0A077WER5_9FUNG|nr:hypothetical protein LRAMOSA07626 [Lichtheimia ramosa]